MGANDHHLFLRSVLFNDQVRDTLSVAQIGLALNRISKRGKSGFNIIDCSFERSLFPEMPLSDVDRENPNMLMKIPDHCFLLKMSGFCV
jgi:hypothetical protein